jgi:glycine hydroxymethyltransferase
VTVIPTSDSSDLRSRLLATDPALADLLGREEARQQGMLTLIASENHTSRSVRAACASVLTDKYAEGYPGKRYYGGCEVADEVEDLARSRARELFGAAHANVQPHSGTTANLAVLVALAGGGGRILGMALDQGGHLSHGFKVSHTGKLFESAAYGVDPETGLLDMDRIREQAKQFRPAVLIAGASSYPREIDFGAFAEIAREVGAALLADIAHPAGLIAAGKLASPIGHAEVVTMTTHKTLRGPRGGLILCRDEEIGKKIDASVFPGAQGGPLMHQIAGKAVAFGEALQPAFRDYQESVRDNARHLAECLQNHGLRIVTGGTDNHLVLVDLRGTEPEITGADAETLCMAAGISANKNMVPGDPRPPRVTSGLRLGTAAATTRGFDKPAIQEIADVMASVIRGEDPAALRPRVESLCRQYPVPF